MPKTPDGKDAASRPGKRGIDIPSKAPFGNTLGKLSIGGKDGGIGFRRRRLFRFRHQLEGGLLQRKGTGVAQQFIEKQLGEKRCIGGCAEDSCMTRDASHSARRWIVNCAAQHLAEVGIGGGCAFVIVGRRSDVWLAVQVQYERHAYTHIAPIGVSGLRWRY